MLKQKIVVEKLPHARNGNCYIAHYYNSKGEKRSILAESSVQAFNRALEKLKIS